VIKLSKKFILDKDGNKKSVVLPYRQYEALMEDIHDLAVIAERRNEKAISHAELKRRLKKDGLL